MGLRLAISNCAFWNRFYFLSNEVKMGSKNGKPVIRDEDIEALSKSSGLEKEEVKKAFNNFVAEHPDGRMKPKAFREMMSQALPKKDASKMEKHVFRAYDSNNDGYIDFVEFMVIFYIMADGSPEEVLGKIFRVFDVNSDGSITNKEMQRLVKDMYGLLKTEEYVYIYIYICVYILLLKTIVKKGISLLDIPH